MDSIKTPSERVISSRLCKAEVISRNGFWYLLHYIDADNGATGMGDSQKDELHHHRNRITGSLTNKSKHLVNCKVIKEGRSSYPSEMSMDNVAMTKDSIGHFYYKNPLRFSIDEI